MLQDTVFFSDQLFKIKPTNLDKRCHMGYDAIFFFFFFFFFLGGGRCHFFFFFGGGGGGELTLTFKVKINFILACLTTRINMKHRSKYMMDDKNNYRFSSARTYLPRPLHGNDCFTISTLFIYTDLGS